MVYHGPLCICRVLVVRILLRVCSIHDMLWTDAYAVLHVKYHTVDGNSVQQSSCHVGIVEEGIPFVKSELGGNEGSSVEIHAKHCARFTVRYVPLLNDHIKFHAYRNSLPSRRIRGPVCRMIHS